MNKKFIAVFLAVIMVLGMTASVFASDFALYMRPPGTSLKMEVFSGNTGAASIAPSLSTTITAGNRILGFSYSSSAAGGVAIFDDSAITNCAAGTLTNLKGEVFAAAGTTETLMFPLPLTLENGLVVSKSGTTASIATVYYE